MAKKNPLSEARKKPDAKDEPVNPSDLPGWPGYRTRDGRSGYDPIDARTEAAHISGAFIQNLFTGKLRISNPLSLVLLGLLGVLLVLPLLVAIYEVINGNLFSWEAGLTLFIAGMVGFALLTNFIKNLVR